MTAFDLYQFATAEIASGKRAAAAMTLTHAIRQIDHDGVDHAMRGDLVALRKSMFLTPVQIATTARVLLMRGQPEAAAMIGGAE